MGMIAAQTAYARHVKGADLFVILVTMFRAVWTCLRVA